MILDEKVPPPPPYFPASTPRRSHNGPPTTLTTLPPHLLLQIVYMTFPQTPGKDEGTIQRQRRTLYWLSSSLRLVNRALYIACMHVLRSTYLPSYTSLIRPPYSSDPFPTDLPSSTTPTPPPPPTSISTLQRETPILDLFIILKVREDVWSDASELHLERDESFRDLFDLAQPRARLEDLIRHYGLREGVITLQPPSSSKASSPASTPNASVASLSLGLGMGSTKALVGRQSPPLSPSSSSIKAPLYSPSSPLASTSTPTYRPNTIKPIPFSLLSVSFSTRRVGLIMQDAISGRKKTIVEVKRERDEKLEVAAKRIARDLRAWLVNSARS